MSGWVLAAAAVLGFGAVFLRVTLWVLSMFDHARGRDEA